jgi:hypothetical protein
MSESIVSHLTRAVITVFSKSLVGVENKYPGNIIETMNPTNAKIAKIHPAPAAAMA